MAQLNNDKAADAAVTLQKALDLLEARGWVQGTEKNLKGQMCLIGAIRTANGPGQDRAMKIVERCLYGGYSSIPGWNDAHGRSYTEVRTVLLASITIAKELAE